MRNSDLKTFDIHDRVNYSVTSSSLVIEKHKSGVTLNILIDTAISSLMDYFEIFLSRMKLCKRAAETLGLDFNLVINERKFM